MEHVQYTEYDFFCFKYRNLHRMDIFACTIPSNNKNRQLYLRRSSMIIAVTPTPVVRSPTRKTVPINRDFETEKDTHN